MNGYSRLTRSNDYPFGVPVPVVEGFRDSLVEPGDASGDDLPLMAPSMASDAEFAAWWRRTGHRGASPSTARAVWRAAKTDLRPVLKGLEVPTLVLHARDDQLSALTTAVILPSRSTRASVELDTADHVPWTSAADIPGEVEEFLTGTRQMVPSDRVLATVLFSDIVGSTEQASEIGDRVWTALLEQHDRAIDRQLARFGGRTDQADRRRSPRHLRRSCPGRPMWGRHSRRPSATRHCSPYWGSYRRN